MFIYEIIFITIVAILVLQPKDIVIIMKRLGVLARKARNYYDNIIIKMKNLIE